MIKLTIKSVRDQLAPLGVALNKLDNEYRVRVKGSADGAGYFTTDLADALETGRQMAEEAKKGQA